MTQVLLPNRANTIRTDGSLPFLPSPPPTAPQAALSYSRALQAAPYTALMGVVVDGRQPPRHPTSPRYRIRNQVGGTNRWRLPESLGGDLLGTAQAVKSLNEPYNQNIVNIMTAENPATSLNHEDRESFHLPSMKRPQSTQNVSSSALRQSAPRLPVTAPAKTERHTPIPKFEPSTARPPTPLDIFHYHSAPAHSQLGPDVLLHCLGTSWELHRPFIQKSTVLSEILSKAEIKPHHQCYYRDPLTATVDRFISKSDYYSNEYRKLSRTLSITENKEDLQTPREETKGIDHPSHLVEARRANMTKIKLKVRDPLVTKEAFAVALGNLYHEELDPSTCDMVGVLASAYVLGFTNLQKRCHSAMSQSIQASTVCRYHHAALVYKVGELVSSCERWLEVHLVSHLSIQIYLRDLPQGLLQRIITSSRFFTFNEYTLYRTLCYWVFLKMNPSVQLMPSHSTIVTFFNSLSRSSAFIEGDDGQCFVGLFMALRMSGITDTRHLDDMLRMNVVPQSWVLKVLSHHYHALQGGGDMSLMLNFNTDALRYGFIIEQEPRYHTQTISVHGFHFELKAHRQGSDPTYQFYIQRLKPQDSTLSFRICERQTFSLRQDREVLYSIRVQCKAKGQDYCYSTGMRNKKFGLGSTTSKSDIFTLNDLCLPICVTYQLLFPPS
ncbi:BTB/POZ domain-containing protein 16-like [Apostichopus japonicus]|uniref:BTB/POZ domain-containing protein 16-like n=1 Tax=Stichopus japonicus TaxID=307972 RepID=UPI003AB87F3E